MELLGIDLAGIGVILVAIIGIIIFLTVTRRVVTLRKRVPPSKALIIYGRGKTVFGTGGEIQETGVRIVTGGGGFIFPVLEQFGEIDLRVMTISKEKDEVYTLTGVPIRLDWVAQVQIGSTQVSLLTAARAFLGIDRDEVRKVIAQTLSANFRAIVGQLTVEDVHRDRDAFVNRVQELASDDMAAMGITVISMGIEEITDDQGYFEAMAAPKIALVKRDAAIAEAEADQEARVKAAAARQTARQAEIDADREIVEQQEAFQLREVHKDQQVGLAKAASDRQIQEQRALAVEQEQEATILVPARANREAVEIKANADKQRVTITAEAEASATRERASADAEATEVTGNAEAEKTRALAFAEAEGMSKLALATAAEGEVNLRQLAIEQFFAAEVEKAKHYAGAIAGLGGNMKIVQFGGDGGSATGNVLLDTLMQIPEVAAKIDAQVEALTGEGISPQLGKILVSIATLDSNGSEQESSDEPDDSAPDEQENSQAEEAQD